MWLKSEQKGDYLQLACADCGGEIKAEYLGWDPGVPHFKATSARYGGSTPLKLLATHWKGLPVDKGPLGALAEASKRLARGSGGRDSYREGRSVDTFTPRGTVWFMVMVDFNEDHIGPLYPRPELVGGAEVGEERRCFGRQKRAAYRTLPTNSYHPESGVKNSVTSLTRRLSSGCFSTQARKLTAMWQGALGMGANPNLGVGLATNPRTR